MTKRAKIYIFLIFLVLVFILYLILTAEPLDKIKNLQLNYQSQKIADLEENYKVEAKQIFNEYLALINQAGFTQEQISQIKNKLLDLKVPTKFKDLHINLVLALTKMEDYLATGDQMKKTDSQQIINQVETENYWLKN